MKPITYENRSYIYFDPETNKYYRFGFKALSSRPEGEWAELAARHLPDHVSHFAWLGPNKTLTSYVAETVFSTVVRRVK